MGDYFLFKNGDYKVVFTSNNNQKEIICGTVLDFNNNSNMHESLTYKDWNLNCIFVGFEKIFNFQGFSVFNFNYLNSIKQILTIVYDFVIDNKSKDHFLQWIKIADSSIKDLVFDLKNKSLEFRNINEFTLNIESLSLGTKKWILLYFFLYIDNSKFQHISNLIIFDEVENSFHQKLVQVFLEAIDHKKNYTQLVFTTHNPNIFPSDFRQDGIYLTNTNSDSFSCIHTLDRYSKFKLRKDKKICSSYLNELIGCHPNNQEIIDFWNISEKNVE